MPSKAFRSSTITGCGERLEVAKRDDTATGIRDYAILMLLSQYGMRAGEIVALRRQSIGARKLCGFVIARPVPPLLPLLPDVGNASLKYLQKGRPKTAFREVFLRDRAPLSTASKRRKPILSIRRRVDVAGVVTSGKRGPHAFRHARAVSMLRAKVPLKEIGDVLGHRLTISTMTYLKLATEDCAR